MVLVLVPCLHGVGLLTVEGKQGHYLSGYKVYWFLR